MRSAALALAVLALALAARAEDELADPTRPEIAAAAPASPAATAGRFDLRGVLIGKTRRVAVINGRALGVGESVDGEFATVRSKIVTSRGAEIPVDYRLHVVGSRWQVYDVVVQGVSFVANYRGQFDRIIRTSSYAQLMRDLRAKYAQAPSRPVTGSRPAASAPASATMTPTAAPAKAEE